MAMIDFDERYSLQPGIFCAAITFAVQGLGNFTMKHINEQGYKFCFKHMHACRHAKTWHLFGWTTKADCIW